MSIKDLITQAAAGDASAIAQLEQLEERVGYLEGELDTAIKTRDKAKQSVHLSKTEKEELDLLRAAKAEADEAQLKAKGDYEALKTKAEKQVAEAEAKASAAADRFANKAIETAGESTGTSASRADIIKRAAAGDPDARTALAKLPQPGRQVSGPHWDRPKAAAAS